MSEKPSEPDKGAPRGDVVRLYSQAHAPGNRYWDFSASRKQVQKRFRDRIAREHAERAGVEPAESGPRPALSALEQLRSAQFQSSLSQFPDIPQSPRYGPVLAPQSGPPFQTRDLRELASLRPSGAAPRPPASPPSGAPGFASPAAQEPSARWFALQSVFAPAEAVVEPPVALPPGFAQRPPTFGVFSLAGGVGKTCVVATLGRALSALGEQVLLADTSASGVLPFYFGSRESKPGVVRTFFPPPFSPSLSVRLENQIPVQLLNLEAERFPRFDSGQDWLLGKLVQDSRGLSRILIDVATASREVSRLLLLQPTILVPILPDVNSIASLQSIESWLTPQGPDGGSAQVFFLLNQFDVSSALHRDLREMLQSRLGDRLLPFVLRSCAAVSEALAEGMTVMDYAPDSTIAEDYRSLAAWLSHNAAAAVSNARGARWRER